MGQRVHCWALGLSPLRWGVACLVGGLLLLLLRGAAWLWLIVVVALPRLLLLKRGIALCRGVKGLLQPVRGDNATYGPPAAQVHGVELLALALAWGHHWLCVLYRWRRWGCPLSLVVPVACERVWGRSR